MGDLDALLDSACRARRQASARRGGGRTRGRTRVWSSWERGARKAAGNWELWKPNVYSTSCWRRAIGTVHGSYVGYIKPGNVLQSHAGVPRRDEMDRRKAHSTRNITVARVYLVLKLLAAGVLEAMERGGGKGFVTAEPAPLLRRVAQRGGAWGGRGALARVGPQRRSEWALLALQAPAAWPSVRHRVQGMPHALPEGRVQSLDGRGGGPRVCSRCLLGALATFFLKTCLDSCGRAWCLILGCSSVRWGVWWSEFGVCARESDPAACGRRPRRRHQRPF